MSTAARHPAQPRAPGIVSVGDVLTAAEFRRRMGLNDHSWREARRAGLRTIKVGKKLFVRGADWASFLERIAEQS